MIDILNPDPRFTNDDYFDILIQNSFKYRIYITSFQKVFLSHFLPFYFLKCLCGVHKNDNPPRVAIAERC